MVSIDCYIKDILEDFKEYLEEGNELCFLKSLQYQSGMIPEYNDIHIQQLYLLRYVFAYAFEYKSMFGTLFGRKKYSDSIKITSVGCGNMIDYWSLLEALGERGERKCIINYRGVDTVDWNYKIKPRLQDNMNYIKSNAADSFDNANKLISDIYIFPKSISEFSLDDFEKICNAFKNKVIVKNSVHILISLRVDDGSMDRDMSRTEKLINSLNMNGFATKDTYNRYIYYSDENKGIKGYDYKFNYPNEAIDIIKSLNQKCCTFINSGQNCEDECKMYLNRWPVLKPTTIRYQVLTFERKEQS